MHASKLEGVPAVDERSRTHRGRVPKVKAHHSRHLLIGHQRLQERKRENEIE